MRVYSADEPIRERAVLRAVGRLLPVHSPLGPPITAGHLAYCGKVDHRPAHEIRLMACAYRGRTIRQ